MKTKRRQYSKRRIGRKTKRGGWLLNGRTKLDPELAKWEAEKRQWEQEQQHNESEEEAKWEADRDRLQTFTKKNLEDPFSFYTYNKNEQKEIKNIIEKIKLEIEEAEKYSKLVQPKKEELAHYEKLLQNLNDIIDEQWEKIKDEQSKKMNSSGGKRNKKSKKRTRKH
jgi:hypothetical protein